MSPNGDSSSAAATARIAIDRGGTFTDAICSRPGEEDIVIKVSLEAPASRSTSSEQRHDAADASQLLSVDPQNYKDAPTEASVHSSYTKTPADRL